jgi:hypothetical protein
MSISGLDNFKKSLEDYLESMQFIYSGDVVSSIDKFYQKKLKHSSFSAELMKDVMVDVYKSSIDKMIENSKEVVIHRDNFVDVYKFIEDKKLNSSFLFYSGNSNKNLNLGGSMLPKQNIGQFLPDYFTRKFKLMSFGVEISAFFSPYIKDTVDDCHFYLVDKPIQSMVWSLQNMTYDIHRGFSSYDHTVKLPIYDCSYSSLRVRVINTQKLREEKINILLNGN